MPIIPWKPFWDIDRWFEEMEPEMRNFPMVRTPRMNVYETEKEVVAEVELPGVESKDIDVEVKENILRIEAKTEKKKEEKEKGYYRKEISSGYFRRAIPLPVEVIGVKADASYKEGILKIVIPKAETKKGKKGIKVKIKNTN